MMNIMSFADFWFFLVSSDIADDNKYMDLRRIGDLEKKLDALYQHLEHEIDEKCKHKGKKAVKLDDPTKRQLDNLVAIFQLAQKKREYLTNQLKVASAGSGEYTA